MSLFTNIASTVAIGTVFKMYNLLGENNKLPANMPYLTPSEPISTIMIVTTSVALSCLKKPLLPLAGAFGACYAYAVINTLNNRLKMKNHPDSKEDGLQLKFSTPPITPEKVVIILEGIDPHRLLQARHLHKKQES